MFIEELPDHYDPRKLIQDPPARAVPGKWWDFEQQAPYKSPGIGPGPGAWPGAAPKPQSPAHFPFFKPEPSEEEIARARNAQKERSDRWASGVEGAQGALGARHFFREALSKGSMGDVYRVFGALIERGFEKEALQKGKSETLSAAALGGQPELALVFLHQKGFRVCFELAQMALLAALAKAAPLAPRAHGLEAQERKLAQMSVKILIELFEAGSNDASALGAIKAIDPALQTRSTLNQERWELSLATGGATPLPSKSALRV